MTLIALLEGQQKKNYLVCDDIEGGHEELVTDEGEGVEHVDDPDHVEDHSALSQLVASEKVWRKQGIVHQTIEKNKNKTGSGGFQQLRMGREIFIQSEGALLLVQLSINIKLGSWKTKT